MSYMETMMQSEEEKKQIATELFAKALAAAPDSFIKGLTGKTYAAQIVDGTKVLYDYLFPSK